MKKSRIQFITFILGAILLNQACTTANGSVITPPQAQNAAPATVASASPAPTFSTLASTPLPVPTATPLPSPTSQPSPTIFRTPFLPAGLAIISPQNASRLKPVAVLSEQGASVVAFSFDSRLAAAGLFVTHQVKIWDLVSGQELWTLGGHVDPRIISYLAFSPDGARLASGAQGWDAPNDSLILWNLSTGDEVQRFDGVLGAISTDWRLVALTKREQGQGTTLILSDLTSGEEIRPLKAPGDIYGVSFSPQGRQVAAKMYNVFQDLFSFWSVDNGRLDRTVYDWVGFSFSPDGHYLAALLETGSGAEKGELNIFDAATFKWIKTLAKEADSFWFTNPAFSPDGQILAASFSDHVKIWETQTWKELTSLPSPGPTNLAFSPNGCILTTSTQAGMVQLWGAIEKK
jgi:WD40 repeat protein